MSMVDTVDLGQCKKMVEGMAENIKAQRASNT